jgi:hypothetical protein
MRGLRRKTGQRRGDHLANPPADGEICGAKMKIIDKFLVGCAGTCIILGFIAFGYLMYKFIGDWTLLVTSVFMFLVGAGINVMSDEIKSVTEKKIRLEYENQTMRRP